MSHTRGGYTIRRPRRKPASRRFAGSCTNSSYEDIERAAHIARQAAAKGLRARVPFYVSPGSDQIFATIRRDGQLADLEAIGGVVLANACGPCIGQWKRDDIAPGERNSIVTSFNRNFPARNDANLQTLAFIGSPETVVAMALAGDLGFDPARDTLEGPGGPVSLVAPTGDELRTSPASACCSRRKASARRTTSARPVPG
jgi:aconitate hydratase